MNHPDAHRSELPSAFYQTPLSSRYSQRAPSLANTVGGTSCGPKCLHQTLLVSPCPEEDDDVHGVMASVRHAQLFPNGVVKDAGCEQCTPYAVGDRALRWQLINQYCGKASELDTCTAARVGWPAFPELHECVATVRRETERGTETGRSRAKLHQPLSYVRYDRRSLGGARIATPKVVVARAASV